MQQFCMWPILSLQNQYVYGNSYVACSVFSLDGASIHPSSPALHSRDNYTATTVANYAIACLSN